MIFVNDEKLKLWYDFAIFEMILLHRKSHWEGEFSKKQTLVINKNELQNCFINSVFKLFPPVYYKGCILETMTEQQARI